MRNGQRESEQQQFIEAVGLSFEQAGLPRMAGRILGWLLICDPPHQSPGELAEVLQASKGSISSMTRLLEQIGLIERLSLPGERRDYFRIRSESWTALFKRRMELVSNFRQLADRGLELLSEHTPEQRRRLEEMRNMYAFFEYEVPRLLERWEQERRSQSE
ncbi:MAG: GbsR/MarR family transcriptional regulator [Chloroflexaceae bacterium]